MEYKIITGDVDEVTNQINKLAQRNWEVVSMIQDANYPEGIYLIVMLQKEI